MKKMFALVFTFTLILAISAPVFAADSGFSSNPVTISFEKNGRSYEMTFTNVADSVVTDPSDGQLCPYIIFYYPDATVSVAESPDNVADFTNGFFLEADYHFGADGKVNADTPYVIEDVFNRLFKILNGTDLDPSDGTGTVGLGPVFLTPWNTDVLS